MGSNLSYHECIGSGASGKVYRATWKSKEHGTIQVAAKKVEVEGEIPGQLRREIEFLKKLDHKNIIKYYDTIKETPYVVIITEYAAKGSLHDYLEDKSKLPEKLLYLWIFHLARGIDYLKQNHVTHRDLKSPNCVLTADDVLKICDFGIAKDLTSTKTTKSTKGSVRWQAPEIFKDLKLSPKADIFAFGIIVWEMVSCEELYKGMRSEAVVYQVMAEGLRPKIPEDCPSFLKELMEKCWHEDREQRPNSNEIVELFGYLLSEENGFEWKLKHRLNHTFHSEGAVRFVASDRLAICRPDCVEVHQVTREDTHLLYTLTCDEWRDVHVWPQDVATSESIPDSILVICRDPDSKPYVYQLPCHESRQYVKKYKIHDESMYTRCIAANANTVVIGIGIHSKGELVVCSLPQFTQQSTVRLSFHPHDLSITTDYLLVMGWHEMVVKPLGNLGTDLCKIQPPDDGGIFRGIAFRNNARQIYARSDRGVYKYTWDGKDTPQYSNTGCVIDKLNVSGVLAQWLSVSKDGLLAVHDYGGECTEIFCLE